MACDRYNQGVNILNGNFDKTHQSFAMENNEPEFAPHPVVTDFVYRVMLSKNYRDDSVRLQIKNQQKLLKDKMPSKPASLSKKF